MVRTIYFSGNPKQEEVNKTRFSSDFAVRLLLDCCYEIMFQKQSSKIVLVGVETSVNAANQEITKHLKDNIVEKRKIKLKPGFDRFLRDLHEHIKASLHLAHVKWEVHSGMQSEISLEGKCFDLDKGDFGST